MATTNSLQSIPVPLPIFDGTDYDLWEEKMITLFKSQNLWGIVQQDRNEKKNEQKEASALYLIQQSLAQNVFRRITGASTAKQAWDMLRREFLGDRKGDMEATNGAAVEATYGAAMEATYGAAMEAEWNKLVDYYKDHSEDLFTPVTGSSDTVLHLAIQSNEEQPLKNLLEIMEKSESPLTADERFLKKKNKFGNTALHEATIYGNYEAVTLLVDLCPDLIKIGNVLGETPLFTAAGFAEIKIVEFLIGSGLEQCLDADGHLLPIHRKRTEDDLSILSAAIIGQKFETALLLLEMDTSLASLKDKNEISTLQLLAEMPTSAFESRVPMGICERFIYSCLPVPRPCEVKSRAKRLSQERKTMGDLESGQGSYSVDHLRCGSEKNQRGGLLNYLKIPKIPKGGWLERIWNKKTKRVFALPLAKSLIKKDESLKVVTKTEEDQNKEEENEEREIGLEKNKRSGQKEISAVPSLTIKKEIPLFTATRRGIENIVRLIIKHHPHAMDKRDDMGRSILDVAVMYRQQKIFDIIVNEKKVPLARLRRVLDNSGNTLLHHVADMKKNSGVTKPGPALQLQEELKWFEQVEKVIPSYYVPLLNKEGKTARECFEIAHEEKLEKAQLWIKETSQSCSTVAALVSTVVFAAAYTVPGGSDEKGKPIFINSPYFLIFTVTDVVSLASSLTSLVMFLSLLTSPFELQEFHTSLPRKLIVGLFFLFFSVLTTMISFGATILILIQTERELTTLLLSIASFLPVFVFGILQFRMFVSFLSSTLNIHKIKSSLVTCLPWGKKAPRRRLIREI
ncbi:hypothetical protein OIU84_002240 [Salix udensis]|uniref:PGG domain-containing protein n=1 Tax=Salix udensis TaxID=889485 RepID=A0AAD6K3K4_9ROSI|nr:hypothetical protein OIU84_002240 [Salix udensis]